MNTLTIVSTGEQVSFVSATVSGNIDDFTHDVSFDIADYQTYRQLKPPPGGYTEVQFDVLGIVFHLLIEDGRRGWQISDDGGREESYSVSGRSKVALLDKPHAKELTKTWNNTTAQTITNELCTAANVTLDWTIADWPLKTFSIDNTTTIDAIITLVGEKGTMAIVQPTLDGKLRVCKRDKLSPAKYKTATHDYIISDDNHLFLLTEKLDERGKYGWIEIANENVNSDTHITFETIDNIDSITIKVFVTPFKNIQLEHSGLSYVNAVYQGVFTEQVTDTVTLIDGKGSLSKPFYGFVSANWFYRNLGNLSITEQGEITAQTMGHSLVDVTYITKYHRYRATATNAIVKALAYTETT